jgi:hypothetical protein
MFIALFLFIASLLALWAFIIWDRRRITPPLSRKAMARGWAVSPLAKWPVHAGLSAMSAVMAAAAWVNPSLPPFTGRLSSVFTFAYSYLGPQGVAYFWGMVAMTLAVFAVVPWRPDVAARNGNGNGNGNGRLDR